MFGLRFTSRLFVALPYGISNSYGDQLELEDADDEADDDGDITAQDEVRLAPWRLTQDFLNCVRDKCLLYITGKAEPTGCGEGFSYLRLPHKAVSSKAQESKFTPGGYVAHKKAQPLANTNRDLRKLNLAVAKKTLVETCVHFSVPAHVPIG